MLELVLLPGLAAVLPWRVCFVFFRILSRWSFLYQEASQRAFDEAASRGAVIGAAADWLAIRRLVTLVDHADFYLSKTRSNRWMERHLHVHGKWPDPQQPAVLCTFHWGAGMWGLRHLYACGLKVNALVAPLEGEHFKGRWILHQYAIARTNEVARSLHRQTLDVSRSLKPALTALKADEQVLAVIDVPADQVDASISIPFLEGVIAVPRGMLRLAVDRGLPVSVHLLGLNLNDGSRTLKIRSFGVSEDVEELASTVFKILDEAVMASPAAWHFWSEAPRFFVSER